MESNVNSKFLKWPVIKHIGDGSYWTLDNVTVESLSGIFQATP